MLGSGTGAEVTRRIAAPMVGGVLGLLPLALLVVPALFLLYQRSLGFGASDQAGSQQTLTRPV